MLPLEIGAWFPRSCQKELAVILVIGVGTIRLIGSNANSVFSPVASSMQ